jgi:HK97 family phage major capsid protein
MLENLQKSLKAVTSEADALIQDVGTREPTAAENQKLAELASKASNLTNQIDNVQKLNTAKSFANESAGSYVAASFSREANPGEGDIPGVTADPHSGEMHVVDGQFKSAGQKKLDNLKSGAYKDAFADYIRTAGLGRQSMKGDAMKILNEGTDTSGGFWLPPDFRPDLIKRTQTISSVRQNASVFTTGTDHITFPQVQYTGASDDTLATLFSSGVRFSWRTSAGSTSDISEATNPVAGQINIPAHLATAAIILTREQLEDNSFDLLGYITQLGGEAFGLGEESAFTTGSGAGQPLGFTNHPAKTIAASTTGAVSGVTYTGMYIPSGTAASLTWTSTSGAGYGITGLEADLPPQYEQGAKWYGSKKTYAAIRQINAGTSTLPQWALGDAYPNYSNNMSPSLLGYGIQKNQFMDAVGANAYPLALGDMKGYYIVDRVGLSVEVFREVYGLRDQVVVYMRKRTGGQLVKYWSMRFLKCATS